MRESALESGAAALSDTHTPQKAATSRLSSQMYLALSETSSKDSGEERPLRGRSTKRNNALFHPVFYRGIRSQVVRSPWAREPLK